MEIARMRRRPGAGASSIESIEIFYGLWLNERTSVTIKTIPIAISNSDRQRICLSGIWAVRKRRQSTQWRSASCDFASPTFAPMRIDRNRKRFHDVM